MIENASNPHRALLIGHMRYRTKVANGQGTDAHDVSGERWLDVENRDRDAQYRVNHSDEQKPDGFSKVYQLFVSDRCWANDIDRRF